MAQAPPLQPPDPTGSAYVGKGHGAASWPPHVCAPGELGLSLPAFRSLLGRLRGAAWGMVGKVGWVASGVGGEGQHSLRRAYSMWHDLEPQLCRGQDTSGSCCQRRSEGQRFGALALWLGEVPGWEVTGDG